jgi:outer membrane protein assembly factor BamA
MSKSMSKSKYNPLWMSLALGLLLSSCNTTKFLDVDQFLLKKNQLLIHEEENIANKGTLTYEMETLYKQKPNSNLFFVFPREWFWFKTNEPGDTSGFDRWQRRVLSEIPAIFDEKRCNETETAIEDYLKNKGYFNSEATYEEVLRKKKAWVTYHVYPKKRTYIDTLIYHSSDRRVDSILQSLKRESLIRSGEPLDSRLYDQEKERIALYMRNQGYANFLSNYVAQLTADTIKRKGALVTLEVLPPLEDSVHQSFKVGKIVVFPYYSPEQESPYHPMKDTLIQGLIFRNEPDSSLYFKSGVLLDAVKARVGLPFRQTDLETTQRELAASGVFKFVRIKQLQNAEDPTLLDIWIFLTPNPKLEMGADFEVSLTNRATQLQNLNLIGFSLRPSVRNRNIFKGAETLVTSLRAGVEINPLASKERLFNTLDVGFQNDLYLPKFKDYLGIWKLVDDVTNSQKKQQSGAGLYNLLKENASSRFSLGYSFTKLIDFYDISIFNMNYSFEFKKSKQRTYSITNFAAEYFKSKLTPTFIDVFKNPLLIRSFDPRFIVSILFREINYDYVGRTNSRGENIQTGVSFETAGSELSAINAITNAITGKKDTFNIDNIDFAQYALLETSLKYYRQFTPKTTLAARLGFGIVRPFGTSDVVPFIKQFSAGGPNSIRAWPARGLGPGGFIDTTTFQNSGANKNLYLVNTGDLWLEANLEYRFNIYWLLNGAFFLDAGNVWNIKKDPSRPGSPFFFSDPDRPSENSALGEYDAFYKQIAIGSGFGLRLDIRYFILRLDLGMKIRYPYRWDGENFWNPPSLWFKRMNLNLGLGMPF